MKDRIVSFLFLVITSVAKMIWTTADTVIFSNLCCDKANADAL